MTLLNGDSWKRLLNSANSQFRTINSSAASTILTTGRHHFAHIQHERVPHQCGAALHGQEQCHHLVACPIAVCHPGFHFEEQQGQGFARPDGVDSPLEGIVSCETLSPGFPHRHHQARIKNDLSSPKPGHTTGGSRRGARRGGGARSGRTGCQQNCSPRRQCFLVLSKASKTHRPNVAAEPRTNEIPLKPMIDQNPRLTKVHPQFITGSSLRYRRDKKRSFFLATDQWTVAFLFP